MLDLSTISFKVETSELDRAGKAIGELVTNVGKLDKAARDAAQTEVALAKAAKLNADANLQNAKAQDVRLKSTITADKADQASEKAIVKKTKALEDQNNSLSSVEKLLIKTRDAVNYMTDGLSRGQAIQTAHIKSLGATNDQIDEFIKLKQLERKLIGKDTFDDSQQGLLKLKNAYSELRESIRQYNAESGLTSKQTRELARDKERIIESNKALGASFQDIRKAVRARNDEYIKLAEKYNKAISAEEAVIKSRKEAVNATNYLTQADQKMAAALNTSNAALDKAGTDSLVKYETALRKSGVSQDVATLKLAKYKAQLEQVQIQEQKRREEHLTRALAPQATDIVVSLWSGQNPLTVLLQQGGQVTDLFMQSGIAAEKFGEVVKSSMKSMLPSILTVVKGVGGLLVDGFAAAGNAVSGFLASVVGMQGAMDKLYMKMSEDGPSKFGGWIRDISSLMSGVFAVGIAGVVTGLVALGVAFKNAIKEGAELNRNLELTGASLGLTKSAAIDLAQSLATSERPVAKSVELINELAKAGKFSSENIKLVNDAAIDLERYGKVSIAETAKELSKLREDPVKALLEVAEKTGYVNLETIATIKSLRDQGKMAEAAELAMKEWAKSSTSAATSIKNQMSPLEQVWDGILSKINQVIGALQRVARGSSTAEQIADKEAQLASVKGGKGFLTPTSRAATIERLSEEIYMLKLQLQAETDITKEREKRSSAAAQLRAEAEATREYTTALEKQASKELTLSAFVKKAVEERTKVVATALGKNVEDVKLSAEAISKITSGAELQWQEMQKNTKSSPSENYYATLMREATNNTIAANTAAQELTKSEQKLLEVRADPRFAKLTATQKQDVISKYEAAIAAEKQTALTEKLAEAEEHRLKLLGKSEGIGKQYYSDMQKLEEFAKVAGWSREEIEELTRAIFMATPAWKAYEKALEEVNSAARKFNEDSIASQAATLKENESLDYRLSLLGKTAEEQKALSIEYNRANKISEVRIKLAKQLRDIEADIEKAKKAGLPEEKYKNLIDAQVQARKDAAEQEKVINREVAVQYAEDLQKEFDAIKNGISDSIVTALFEGGKAGSKKLRDLVVAELKKPVTMVVNAVVNTVLGNVLGSLMGGAAAGAAGGAAGGIAGSALSSIGGSMIGNTVMSSIGSMGGVVGTAYNTALGTSLGLGSSSAAAAAQAASMAGGTSATSASLGSTLGAAMPWIAGAAALYSIISSFDDSGTYHTGGAASYSVATGQRNSLGFRDNEEGLPSYNPNDNIDNQFGTGFGWVVPGKETISAMETLSKSLVEIFDGIAKTFGKTAGYEVAVAFADDTSKDGAWGAFAVRLQGVEILNWDDFRQSKWAPKEFGDGEEGYKQYLAAVAKDTRKILTDMDIPGWAKTILNDIGEDPSMEALSGAIQLLAQVETVFKSFGQYMPQFAILTDSAKETLIRASGGVQALTGNMSSFVNAFYTDAEKLAINSNNLSKELSKLGFEMPKTREEFKALVQSQIELGDSGAESLAALLSLSGAMDAVLPAFNDVTDAVSGLSEVMKGLKEETANLEIELLRAKGDTAGANAAQRTLDTQGFTEAEIAIYDYNQSLRDQITSLTTAAEAVKTLAENARNLRSGLISLEGRFTGGGFSKQYKAEDAAREVNSLLSSVGINKDVATITSALLNSTTDEVQGYFREIWEVLDTDEARLRLVQVSNAMLDIATTSETAAEKFQKQTDAFSKLASDVADLFAARNSAGNLLDKIAGAMGNQGSFAAQREGELWNALGSTSDYKKKVELASQLTDIVLERQQLEIQNAERLLNFGQGLRDYVNGLKLSDLSPLTNAEKLAEASKQYSETLAKAVGGDTNAQSGLQAISSSYLELARTYYAGNEQFSNIFNSVTSALDTLGINSMTESQQQIAIGNQSLEELQKLYGITETAYEALNTQYENSLSQLIAAQDALVLQASSLEQLVSISNLLTNLPTEIAVRLPTVNTELSPLNSSSAGATSDSSNAELLEELKLLRIQVAKLEASNREDARMQADVFVGASQATADSIASATTKAARAAELKQGAIIK